MVEFKNSYMLFEVFLDPNQGLKGDDPIKLEQSNVLKAIEDSILLNFGEGGLASSLGSFKVDYVNPITKLCVIRASTEEHQKVWSPITIVRSIENCPVLLNLLDLSGELKPGNSNRKLMKMGKRLKKKNNSLSLTMTVNLSSAINT